MLPTLLLFQLISFIVCIIFILPLVIYVNKKLYNNIKNEEHLEKGRVIQYIIKHYAQFQFIGWPCFVVSFGVIKLLIIIIPVSQTLTVHILASTLRYAYAFFRDYLQFHSLIIAICRYTFIILESKAEKFGIIRLRRFFIGASIAVPLLTSTLYELTCPIETFYVRWFYGIGLSQEISNNTKKLEESLNDGTLESLAFRISNSSFSPFVIDCAQFFETAIFSIIYSNIIEGILYAKIFIFYHRNDQQENIQRLLSEEARTRRSHNYKCSLQLSVLSWSIEFVTGCLMLIDYSLGLSNDTFHIWMYVHPLVDIFLSGVVIPSAYVLKSDLFREFLYNFGWLRTLRKLLGIKESTVAPNDEESRVALSHEESRVAPSDEI